MKLLLDTKTAVVDREAFEALYDYSCSLPTGKRWKRRRDHHDESKGWVLGEYAEDPNPDLVSIIWRELVVV